MSCSSRLTPVSSPSCCLWAQRNSSSFPYRDFLVHDSFLWTSLWFIRSSVPAYCFPWILDFERSTCIQICGPWCWKGSPWEFAAYRMYFWTGLCQRAGSLWFVSAYLAVCSPACQGHRTFMKTPMVYLLFHWHPLAHFGHALRSAAFRRRRATSSTAGATAIINHHPSAKPPQKWPRSDNPQFVCCSSCAQKCIKFQYLVYILPFLNYWMNLNLKLINGYINLQFQNSFLILIWINMI